LFSLILNTIVDAGAAALLIWLQLTLKMLLPQSRRLNVEAEAAAAVKPQGER
jgi:hypothetical protein